MIPLLSQKNYLKITPTVDMFILFTAKSQTTVADADDYLLKANIEYEFHVERVLIELLRNATGGVGYAHVMVDVLKKFNN